MPNAGKSTLYNALLGEKLAIVNSKAQTTRHRIFGIKNGEGHQIVFSDTPGILRETSYGMHERMMKFVKESVEVHERFDRSKAKKIVVLNKIDKVQQQKLEEKLVWLKKTFDADVYLAISAQEKFQIDVLESYLVGFLPEHPAYFPEDQLTDKTERFFVNEIIRNNVLKLYEEEVPYSVEVVTLLFKEEPKILRLSCEIIVERPSQKPIIIGKQGQSIKRLGIESRKELEQFFQKQVYMELFVKVREDWRNNKKMLDQFGYESE
ncbi:MAG: GTPase Era [Bacteroidetes bacterium]|nr:GTPase Era [Bacteroidota bacterium]